MAKGEGVTIQTIFIVIAVVAFSGLLIAVVIFMNSRDISVALEEMKLYEVRNALTATEISLRTSWNIAPTQALLDVAKESETWDWATVDRSFVEARLKEALSNIVKRKDLVISRAVVTVEPTDIAIKISDDALSAEATQKVSASFLQAQALQNVKTSSTVSTFLGEMADIGAKIGKLEFSIPEYVPGSSSLQEYESAANSIVASYAEGHATKDVNVNVMQSSAVLAPSAGAGGLSVIFALKAAILDKQTHRYFDGNSFLTTHMYLVASANEARDVLDCSTFNGRFALSGSNDALCDAGNLYTCGRGWTSDTARTGDYACTGSYFCSSSEKNGDSPCCAAFGGTIQNVEECAAVAGKNDCKTYDDSGICLAYYTEGECKTTQTVRQCSV